MKTVYIISGVKNLGVEYQHLQWLRMFFLNIDYRLSEDWIHHSLSIKNNKPRFSSAPNFDYMKAATDGINDSDLLVCLISESSTFVLTMLRYAIHKGKKSIVICKNRRQLKGLEYGNSYLLEIYNFANYKEKIRRKYAENRCHRFG
ncbi:MAG: hypothetical protein LBU20_02560 [Candidatus Nomurabacteria bacterium]|jgi:hypothetical protein|nr:hypothetical protein [Candidatus Nomurabacteria bacterium]